MKVQQLGHVVLKVRDRDRSERFYTEVLGLAVVAHLGDQTLLQCGDQNLALFQVVREPLTQGERRDPITPSSLCPL